MGDAKFNSEAHGASAGSASSALAAAIQERDHRFRAVAETSIQGKVVHRAFKPLFVNQPFALATGHFSVEAVMAMDDISGLFDDETRADPARAWTSALNGPPRMGRAVFRRADGSPYTVQFFARVVVWDGEPAIAMAVLDVTREERALEEIASLQASLQRASRTKQRVLESASHDLRTPLHAAMGRIELMLQEPLSTHARSLAVGALAGCRRLLDRVDDLIDAGALQTDTATLDSEPFDLNDVVAQVMESARQDSDGVSLRAQTEGDGALRYCGDEARVRRIALAMLEEALRRTSASSLTFSVEADDRGVSFAVSTPTGRRASDAPHRWDAFDIARAFAERMGGVLVERTAHASWESVAFLPLARAGSTPARGPRPLHVLVVEDNPGNRTLIRMVLDSLGHSVTMAENGAIGVARALERPYDLILMDLSMPEMNGFVAARTIRATHLPWPQPPIAALTANTAPGVRAAVAEAGMDAYLQKPLEMKRLVETIALLTGQGADAPASVDAAEVHDVQQEDDDDEPENDAQRGHVSVPTDQWAAE